MDMQDVHSVFWENGMKSDALPERTRMLGAQALDVMVCCDDVEACRFCWTEKLEFEEVGVRPGPAGQMFPCSCSGPKMPISSLWTVPSSRDSLPK